MIMRFKQYVRWLLDTEGGSPLEAVRVLTGKLKAQETRHFKFNETQFQKQSIGNSKMSDRLIDPTTHPSMIPRSRYIVTIQRVEVNVQNVKEWKHGGGGDSTYGFVTTDAITETTTKLYEQTVESLDVVRVIEAVNLIG